MCLNQQSQLFCELELELDNGTCGLRCLGEGKNRQRRHLRWPWPIKIFNSFYRFPFFLSLSLISLFLLGFPVLCFINGESGRTENRSGVKSILVMTRGGS